MLPTNQHRDKKDAIEAIRDYLISRTGTVTLTDKQQEIYTRLKAAWSLLLNDHTTEDTAAILQKEHGVSLSQACRDVQDCLALYGDTQKTDKEGIRLIIANKAMTTYNIAARKEDIKGMNESIKNLIKIHGLDKEDPEKPDFSKLQASITINILDDQSSRALKKMIAKPGTMDLNDISTIDIEHEEVE